MNIAPCVLVLIMKLNINGIGFVQMFLWSLEFMSAFNDHQNHFFHCIIWILSLLLVANMLYNTYISHYKFQTFIASQSLSKIKIWWKFDNMYLKTLWPNCFPIFLGLMSIFYTMSSLHLCLLVYKLIDLNLTCIESKWPLVYWLIDLTWGNTKSMWP